MSRNRVRSWDEPSFTIQAGGRHAPLHPQAPKMKFIEQNKGSLCQGKKISTEDFLFVNARIQTFPDDFLFQYKNIADGYKMIGNAVPVEFAKQLASVIYKDISEYLKLHQMQRSELAKEEKKKFCFKRGGEGFLLLIRLKYNQLKTMGQFLPLIFQNSYSLKFVNGAPSGIEPESESWEDPVLSVELRGQISVLHKRKEDCFFSPENFPFAISVFLQIHRLFTNFLL